MAETEWRATWTAPDTVMIARTTAAAPGNSGAEAASEANSSEVTRTEPEPASATAAGTKRKEMEQAGEEAGQGEKRLLMQSQSDIIYTTPPRAIASSPCSSSSWGTFPDPTSWYLNQDGKRKVQKKRQRKRGAGLA